MICPHGMPNPKTCVDCMEEGPVEPPSSWLAIGYPFAAKFEGICPCTEPITIDQMIQRWDKGDRTAYCHIDCSPR